MLNILQVFMIQIEIIGLLVVYTYVNRRYLHEINSLRGRFVRYSKTVCLKLLN
jgi:hypothetical protein